MTVHTLLVVLAIILFVVAGVAYYEPDLLDGRNPMIIVCFGIASWFGAHLP